MSLFNLLDYIFDDCNCAESSINIIGAMKELFMFVGIFLFYNNLVGVNINLYDDVEKLSHLIFFGYIGFHVILKLFWPIIRDALEDKGDIHG